MNGPFGARLADRWVRCYTRGLPPDVRTQRLAEIASDVHEQLHRAGPGSARSASVAIASRTLRGVLGDLSWRVEERRRVRADRRVAGARPTGVAALWATATQSWFTPLAVLVGAFDLLFAIAVVSDADSTMPGRVVGPIFLTGFAGALFSGLWLRWRSSHSTVRVSRVHDASGRAAAGLSVLALVGSFALVVGVRSSLLMVAVGTVLLVAVGLGAARVRRPATAHEPTSAGRRGSRSTGGADALIVIGVLPALAMFWMIVPPLVALAVVAGVIGTGPGTRARATT